MLAHANVQQIGYICEAYEELTGDTLISMIEDECGTGDYGTALKLLLSDPIDAQCHLLFRAMDGLGCASSFA